MRIRRHFGYPKLVVASILWLNFYLTKTRVLGAGRTQSKIAIDPLRALEFPWKLKNVCSIWSLKMNVEILPAKYNRRLKFFIDRSLFGYLIMLPSQYIWISLSHKLFMIIWYDQYCTNRVSKYTTFSKNNNQKRTLAK